MSSASTKARNSPRACSTPRFLAPPGPPRSLWTRRNRGSDSAHFLATSVPLSVDPSSTMITSRSVNVWLAMDCRQSPSTSPLL